jgi:hypothetical protein
VLDRGTEEHKDIRDSSHLLRQIAERGRNYRGGGRITEHDEQTPVSSFQTPT